MEIRTLVDGGYSLWAAQEEIVVTTSGVVAVCPPELSSYEVGTNNLFSDEPELDITSIELTPSDRVILEITTLDMASTELIPNMTASVVDT